MTKSTIPFPSSEDAADALAKEIINVFCTNVNNFMRHRVMQVHMTKPLEGFTIPAAALARKIRECATQLGVQPAAAPEAPPMTWFDDASPGAAETVQGGPPANPAYVPPANEPPAQAGTGVETMGGGESVSLNAVLDKLKTRKFRLNALADELGLSPESLNRFINRPNSGLTIAAGGWVQVAA
jgi:hypothetical protein